MRTYLFGLLILMTSASAQARAGSLWAERGAGFSQLAEVPNFKQLARQVMPAVVSIQVEQKVVMSQALPRGRGQRGQPDPYEFFHRFFGEGMPREYRNRGIGTGFMIHEDGLILTNFHVVENADRIEVTFSLDGGEEKRVLAKVLGTAPAYDVALLQLDEKVAAPIAYLGDSGNMEIGDWVMAVGNPFGLSHSVSVGIISAKERRDIAPSGRPGYYNFLQTDASINPGNSGGPLINMRGEVIGINTAINAQGSGIGFAIPINMVKNMLGELKEKGGFTRSWLGIRIQGVTEELAESYGYSKETGALVAEVVEGGPAAKAGLKEGDIIVEFDGKTVKSHSDLPLFASMAGVGNTVRVKVFRRGRLRTLKVKLEAFPDDDTAVAMGGEGQDEEGALGMTVGVLTPELRQRLEVEDRVQGALIKEIDRDGIAARAGLRPGDVVTRVGDTVVKGPRDFARLMRKAKSGDLIRLKLWRGGSRIYVALRHP